MHFFDLCFSLPGALFPLGFQTKTVYSFLFSIMSLYSSQTVVLTLIINGEESLVF